MKRLDMIANWIYKNGQLGDVLEVPGWPGQYRAYFYPSEDMHLYYGKTSIKVKSKNPTKKTLEKLFKKEIKKRLLDSGWYRSGLRRLISEIKYKQYIMIDDFNGKEVTISGYGYYGKFFESDTIGLFNSRTGVLASLTGYWEEYCGHKK